MASTPEPSRTDRSALAQSIHPRQAQRRWAVRLTLRLCSTVQLSGAELSRNGLHVRLDDIAR